MNSVTLPTVNITIVTHNRIALTRTCLESLFPTLRPGMMVNIVDNGSNDGTQEYLHTVAANHDNVSLHLLPRNMGVAVGANLGWSAIDADYYLKLDNDIEIRKQDWLERLVQLCEENPEVAQAAYRFCDWHEVQPCVLSSGRKFLASGCSNGACVLIPRWVHNRLGFWNEDYGRYGFEDLEYSNRAVLQGWTIGYLEDEAAVFHLGKERDVDEDREKIKLTSRTSELAGEKMYLLNKFLFEQGIRDSYVPRRYLPETSSKGMRFVLNEKYKPIIKVQNDLLERVSYTLNGDTVKLDLSRLKEIR